MARIKERARRRAALSDRKSAASQARMKNIANLASDDRVPKKKRKGGGEDMFGADDADWAIYRKIVRLSSNLLTTHTKSSSQNTTNVSSDEEDDLSQLQLIEQKLLTHDPTFTIDQTHAALSTQRSALLTAFKPCYEDGDVRGNTRIHITTERWRVCETWFSPNLAGVDSAGLGEVIQNVLARFSEAEKGRLANVSPLSFLLVMAKTL
jgi:actin-related protein 5